MKMEKSTTWLTAIPLVYSESPGWWEREAGILCLGFQEIGVHSRFALIGTPRPHPEPFLFGSLSDLQTSTWWKQWNAAGVVLYSWGAPRYEGIARAIKESGIKLVIRMDTDGVNSPRVSFWRYLDIAFFSFRDTGKKFAAARALAKTVLFRFHPPAFDNGFRTHLAHADLIVVESPLAEQRLKRFLIAIGASDSASKLIMMPPQISPRFSFNPTVKKKRQIIAVGRWDCWQKDAPMLISTLSRVLALDSNCTAVIAGSGEQMLRTLLVKLTESVRSRITILGRVAHDQLVCHYRESLTIFFPSRYEGFPNSAVEALSCGCSVVGPCIIASMNYCTMPGCGTVACRRTPEDFADALHAELASWDRGERKPDQFSSWWQQKAWSPNVARRLLHAVEHCGQPSLLHEESSS